MLFNGYSKKTAVWRCITCILLSIMHILTSLDFNISIFVTTGNNIKPCHHDFTTTNKINSLESSKSQKMSTYVLHLEAVYSNGTVGFSFVGGVDSFETTISVWFSDFFFFVYRPTIVTTNNITAPTIEHTNRTIIKVSVPTRVMRWAIINGTSISPRLAPITSTLAIVP